MTLPNRTAVFPRASLSLVAGLFLVAGASAQNPQAIKPADGLTVSVSGAPVEFSTGKPMMQGESVLVPFRAVLEKLGSTVNYDSSTRRIDASTTRHSVQLTPGSTSARVNDRDITMSVAPKLIGGTVYIPLRFVSESLGAKVQYDAAGKSVTIDPASQETMETQTMNEGNSAGNMGATNDANATNLTGNDANNAGNMSNEAGSNMAGNTDMNAATNGANEANGATNSGLSTDPANTPVTNESNVANTTNTAPMSTATTTTTPVTEATEESSSIPWLPILGALAALALGAIIYFALKGRRPGQVIASNSDNNPK